MKGTLSAFTPLAQDPKETAAILSNAISSRPGKDAPVNKVMLSLRISSDLKRRFKAECGRKGMRMEESLDQALRTWLETSHGDRV